MHASHKASMYAWSQSPSDTLCSRLNPSRQHRLAHAQTVKQKRRGIGYMRDRCRRQGVAWQQGVSWSLHWDWGKSSSAAA
jgi:hypothetical protein